MNRSDLQNIALMRVEEAKILLANKYCDGAYYLLGYVIECALKSCIAKDTKEFDFHDKDLVIRAYTHDLEKLLERSGLKKTLMDEANINNELAKNWNTVKDWSESHRYKYGIAEPIAKDLLEAVIADKVGILSWLKKYW